jgi:glycine oxidase
MAKHPDVAVIGGGIVGLTCAYFLAKEGLSVEVFDRGDLGKEASWAGAGIIPPGNPAGAATPIDRLRAIGSMRFPGFSAELRDLTGLDNGYLRCGGIEFLPEDDKDALELWENEGIAFERLARESLRAYEPAVEDVPAAPYLLPGCAQVRNPRHMQALIAARINQYRNASPLDRGSRACGWSRAGASRLGDASSPLEHGPTAYSDVWVAGPVFTPSAGRSCC